MRRSLSIAAPLLLAVQVIGAESPLITPAAREVAFGSIDPSVPPQKIVSVLVKSSAPWTLTVTAAADANPLEAPTPSEAIEIKAAGETWTRLLDGVPLAIHSGDTTNDAAAIVTLELRVKAGLDVRPGRRCVKLRFAALGQEAGADVHVRYEIAPVTRLDDDPRPYESPAVNPARPGLYPYDRHHYLVRSNVPWQIDLLVGTPRSKTTAKELPPRTLVFLTPSGEATPLVPEQPLTIASGNPTTADGAPVDVQLAIRIDDKALAGGEYTADVKVFARAR